MLLLLLLSVPLALADYEDITAIICNNGTDSKSGPTKEWVKQVAEKMQQYAARQSKAGRSAMVKQVDPSFQATLDNYRQIVGPKNNMTNPAPEAHPALQNFAKEGDMIMNPDQIDYEMQKSSRRKKRAVTTDPTVLWTVGTPIAYQIDASLYSIANKIRAGIKFWNDNSCLSYVESSTALPRLRYYKGSGCWSYVGRQNSWGTQDVSIGVGCDSMGTICHETAHAMGFFHTQSRYDRDNYLTINFNNIQSSLAYNFVQQTTATETHFNIPYDYGSVMQYDPYAFAINQNVPTSVAKQTNYQNAMGQREGPSFSDIREMNLLYKCADYCKTKPACVNNGIVNPNTCTNCICPRYFAGPLCQSLNPGKAPVCTGKVVQATSTSYQQLNATAGLGNTNQYANVDQPADCFWMIQGATGRRLQLQITYLSTTCMESCPWGGFEINIGNVEQYGMMFCCQSIYSQTFTTVSNIALIRGYSRYNNVNMYLNYRVI